jgi:hypothetical protein
MEHDFHRRVPKPQILLAVSLVIFSVARFACTLKTDIGRLSVHEKYSPFFCCKLETQSTLIFWNDTTDIWRREEFSQLYEM